MAMILVEHDMGVVMDLADRVLALDFGIADRPRPAGRDPAPSRRDPRLPGRGVRQGRGGHRGAGDPMSVVGERTAVATVASQGPTSGRSRAPTRSRCARSASASGRRSPGRATGSRSSWSPTAWWPSGVEPGDRVAVHSENRPEWLFADAGARWRPGPSPWASTRPTRRPRSQYLLADSGAKVLVAEDQEQVDKALEVKDEPARARADRLRRAARGPRPTTTRPCCPGPSCLELRPRSTATATPGCVERARRPRSPPTTWSTLIYTSGTTGPPKGAMLTVANVNFAHRGASSTGSGFFEAAGPDDLTLSYLPLCHVAERIATEWVNAAAGIQVHFAESIETVPGEPARGAAHAVLRRARASGRRSAGDRRDPDGLGVARSSGPTTGCWMRQAAGDRPTSSRRNGGTPHPLARRLRYALGYPFLFRALRERLGLRPLPLRRDRAPRRSRPRCSSGSSGSAWSIHEIYGMTENSRRGHRRTGPGRIKLGTVGEPHPGHRAAGRRGDRRDPHPPPRGVRRLLGQAREDRRGARGRRLAAHRRRRRVGRRHPPPDRRPAQGHPHHRRRQERLAVRDRELAQVLALCQRGGGGRRPRGRTWPP